VHFNFNRSTLTQAGRDTLNRVIATLQQRSDLRVSVEGHTDPYGSDDYNQGLSERRAQAVVTYLTRGGAICRSHRPEGIRRAMPDPG
jgi:OOP family OmpA-OmpF porin